MNREVRECTYCGRLTAHATLYRLPGGMWWLCSVGDMDACMGWAHKEDGWKASQQRIILASHRLAGWRRGYDPDEVLRFLQDAATEGEASRSSGA